MPLDFDAFSKALNLGVGGFLAFAFNSGWLVPGWVYKDQKARADKYEGLYYDMMRDLRTSTQRIESVVKS